MAERVDVVLASGGNGTVTACAEDVAGSGVPLGVLPAGTGNLLARNLGLPLALDQALAVALTGRDRGLDVGQANGHLFVAMAGIGFDAMLLDSTGEPLKKRLGWLAYARVRAPASAGPPGARRRCAPTAAGRCAAGPAASSSATSGRCRAAPALLPGAEPDDGVLDLMVLTARGWSGWLALAADVMLRRTRTGRVVRSEFRELRVQLDRPQLWELDGEVMGMTGELVVVVQPGQLLARSARAAAARALASAPTACPANLPRKAPGFAIYWDTAPPPVNGRPSPG